MEPGKYTSKQIIEYLKQAPYEEWVKVYNQLNAWEVKTEDSNITLLVMEYIESVAGYTPQLKKLLKEEEHKSTSRFLEKYLLKDTEESNKKSKNGNGKFNKILSSLKGIFRQC